MTRWYGKLLGFFAGAALFRAEPPAGALIGLLLGHAFDADWFGLQRDDPYRILGVPRDATQSDIDLAYRRRMSRCHPDKFGTASDRRRRRAAAEASDINAAYDRIKTLRAPRD